MATPDRLKFKIPRLIEGEAVGRFAIVALISAIVCRCILAGAFAAASWWALQRLLFGL